MERVMTLQGYIDNPAGAGSSAIANRELVRNDLMRRFNELYDKKKDLFANATYKDGNNYFIHVYVPSESKERNNTYDIVLKFSPTDLVSAKNTTSVKGYNIQLFSNSPSFTYTYAYVFDKEGLLVPELKDKFKKETFESPVIRNPYEGISYEKTSFFAIMYVLRDSNLLSKSVLDKGRKFSQLEKMVRTSDKIMIQINKEKNRISEEKKQEEIKNKKKQVRDISIINKPKKGSVRDKVKPIKPRSKIKPKAKTTARTALKSAVAKRKGR